MHSGGILLFALPIILLLTLSLLSGIVMIVGGLKMLRLQSYGWAMTACVIAVLPFNPVGFIGLIIGIWGLVVLNQPSVRAAFRTGNQPARQTPLIPSNSPAWWWVVLLLACIGLILLIPIGFLSLYWLMPM